MCGIICNVTNSDYKTVLHDCKVIQHIKNRGPNCIQNVSCQLTENYKGFFCGSVLWMQGPTMTPQPIDNEFGILLYNGDIFDETWSKATSDTQTILDKLNNSKLVPCWDQHKNITNTLRSLKGPYSLVYYDKTTRKLYFTRDRIGRNSLLFHENDSSFVISSVLGRQYKAVEIPASYIHMLDVKCMTVTLISWNKDAENTISLEEWLGNLRTQQKLADDEFEFRMDVTEFNDEENLIGFIESTAATDTCKGAIMQKLLENVTIERTINELIELLEHSIKLRLQTQPQKCRECIASELSSPCEHCTVGVLFSGGLDCTLLAFLADKYVIKDQPIDLINVAFSRDQTDNYNTPDRITGVESYEELRKMCPNRKWVFRKVNVTKEQLETEQNASIADLVYPRQTILDESLGGALWFAARAQDGDSSSPCRVLILGSGADELFGGYTRHRNAYKRGGWSALQKELTLDWKRISTRNLARDNRVICDHGKQPRMPYLDEDFTDCVLKLKTWLRCFPSSSLAPGIGDKLMLRLMAYKMGLQNVATFPKRALQFGSKIANKKEKGSDISKYFLNI